MFVNIQKICYILIEKKVKIKLYLFNNIPNNFLIYLFK
jgi:hypothetical protein